MDGLSNAKLEKELGLNMHCISKEDSVTLSAKSCCHGQLMSKHLSPVCHTQFGALEEGAATYVDQYKLRVMHIGVGGICLAGTAAVAFVTVCTFLGCV